MRLAEAALRRAIPGTKVLEEIELIIEELGGGGNEPPATACSL